MRRTARSLKDRKILLGVTGSVAAYKAVDLVRRLKDEAASVKVIMTDAAKHFITPLSLQIASGERVCHDLFEDPMAHISLPAEADLLLVAPATANTIGKFAMGLADDLLSTCYLAFRGKVLLAPAMNWRMYENPVVAGNLQALKARGVVEIPPQEGALACGEEGVGRMAEVEDIVAEVRAALTEKDLAGKRIVVTAGPTREHLDAVRFISNRSSGKMGYALAEAARRRGAEVTLISGPTRLAPPRGVEFRPVVSAAEMREAVLKEIKGADVLVMSAAVADFSPVKSQKGKLDKAAVKGRIEVRETGDILAEVGVKKRRPLIIGFAAEAGANLDRAKRKMLRKGADVMVFNDITEPGAGFDVDTNRVVIMDKSGDTSYPMLSKEEVADIVLDRAVL